MDTLQQAFAALEVLPDAAEEPSSSPDFTGRFTSAQEALRYILAGKATVTLRGRRERFTFRVRAPKDGNGQFQFVSVLNGPDNYTNYRYLGYIRRGVYIHGGLKAKIGPEATSAKAWKWTYERLARGVLPAEVEIWHEGNCGRCGRKLTVPSSIASGFGPECINHIH